MELSKLKHLVEVTKHRKDLEAEVKALKEEERELMNEIIGMFEEDGIGKITIGNNTLFVKRELWAGLQDGFEHQDGVAALKAAGFGDLVAEKYDSRTVSSFFREREKKIEIGELSEEDLIPAQMRGVFITNEKFSIGITKA